MTIASVTLDDKYTLERGRVFLSGVQTLTRLLILQAQRDRVAGLKTAGFVSGYRGSPLGGLDRALVQAGAQLKAHDISFQPGVNEELAATSIWGSQQLHFIPQPKYDGVYAMWYGKGPGADRCGDVFKHANYAGTARHGGVLVVAGDDHGAKSSSIAHQSDHQFVAAGIPVLAPAGIQEFLDFGIHGWAMSRYSGLWVGFKITSEAAESSASVEVDPERVAVRLPGDFDLPPAGLSIRWPDDRFDQERRMAEYKVYAAQAYARTNGIDHIVWDGERPRLGIISCGKAYLDVRQALDDLGIGEREAERIGIRLYKVGLVWPLEAEGVRRFAQGLEEILVVEEKRQIIEYQLKEQLYNWRVDARPRVIGKFDERGEWGRAHGSVLLPMTAELTPAIIARAIAARVERFHTSEVIRERLALLDAKERALAQPRLRLLRPPFYCAGCPHNRSTKVPEGSCAFGGVGCHLMAVWMGRNTLTVSQMGGEGAAWIGLAGHTGTRHVFANMGDGTYFHSGLLAIRAAVAANVNITYKILFNDAVAMTGGQPMDGPLSVPQMTRQIESEGVRRIVVMSDEPRKYRGETGFAAGVLVRHRDDLEQVQRELREQTGVTALIYDQTCAAEKRRRRKRGTYPDPARRVFINELVCEGCGDCSVKSNCLAVVPVETEFGRKRAIDQSACNKDYSCLDGLCPSLVTVEGGSVRKGKAAAAGAGDGASPPEPQRPATDRPWDILVTGVGGTGVITIGALLGMAAHLEGKGVSVVDMTGLAQKGGAVFSHVRIADRPDAIHSASIAAGDADAVIGCDLIATVAAEPIERMCPGVTRAVVNVSHAVTGDFIGNPDWQYPQAAMQDEVSEALGAGNAAFIEGTRLATSLTGDAIATNLFMLGFAYQQGLVPVAAEAILRAIELNGTAVEMNQAAFAWGRRAACDPGAVEEAALPASAPSEHRRESRSLDEVIARRMRFLTDYQDRGYARRYGDLVERARRVERALDGGQAARGASLAEAVARSYFRLLAYKDEYEVARLYADGCFEAEVNAAFEGEYRLHFHFAPPLFARVDPVSGEPRKRRFGPWVLPLLKLLARFKGLRGTPIDPFGRSAERRLDRALIAEYEATLAALLGALDRDNLAVAVEIAALPERVRGFGPVRARAAGEMRARRTQLLARFRSSDAAHDA